MNQLIKAQFNKMIPLLAGKAGIIDINGDIIASNTSDVSEINVDIFNELKDCDDFILINNTGYEWVVYNKQKICLIFYEGDSVNGGKDIIGLIKLNILTLLERENGTPDEKSFYRDLFVKNIDEDRISSLCFDLNISTARSAFVLIVEYGNGKRESSVEEILLSIFSNDIIIYIDEAHTAIITDFSEYEDNVDDLLKGIVDEIRLETVTPIYIGIGTKAENIFQYKKSYDNANTALTVGRIFNSDEHVFGYDKLGISMLVYSLPIDVCKQFILDVLPGEALSFFSDKEILNTVKMFFRSNLNMSVAARELYIHRNTLVYRIDKIKKLTGYDLASFDDAVIIKAALMIKDYLDRYKTDREDK